MTPFLGNHSTAKNVTTVTFGLSPHDRESSCLGPPAIVDSKPMAQKPNLGRFHSRLVLGWPLRQFFDSFYQSDRMLDASFLENTMPEVEDVSRPTINRPQ